MVLRRALMIFLITSPVLAIQPVTGWPYGIATALADETNAARPWAAEHESAVRLARQGDTTAALAILERLRREHPGDIEIARDLVVVLVWAARDSDAVDVFTLAPGPHPDYVTEAAGLAYRHLRRAGDALALYREGLSRSPENARLVAGAIRSLADLGQVTPALTLADTDLRARGERLEVLLAAGYAVSAQKKPVEALRYIDRALKLDPAHREARRDRILAINDMGAPQVARRLADEHPGLLTAAELRRIDRDGAAALVRWGVLEPPSEERRFAASDRAIAALDTLIARWSREGEESRSDAMRARFDRMVALRDRVRMTDVVAEYQDLQRQGVALPAHALIAAADAHLYLRQPETARDLYLRALAIDPHNPETRLGLFYAYVELDDLQAAYRQVDAAVADQPIWRSLPGLNDPLENPDRALAELAAANARFYGDELAEAHRRLAAMAESAPNNTRHRTALATIYAARGWPRLAAEEYEISRALQRRNVATEVGQARNNLQLRNYREAEAQLADLKRRFPENLEVQRLDRLWQVHNMAEFRLNAEQAFASATNAQGGGGLALGAQLYSSPFAYNWRVFGAEHIAHQKLSVGEGTITARRSAFGTEYRGPDLVASLEGTLTALGSDSGDTLRSDIDSGRGGARFLGSWSVNDYWQFGGAAELFSRDTPLRALRHGITANSASTVVGYRKSESREFRLAAEAMDFSDGNLRIGAAGQYTERLTTRPGLTLDGILGLGTSRNSADANRPYFNPRQDAVATYGFSTTHALYRRYELSYDHHLVVTPGVYWEQGFGLGGLGSAFYEHRVRANDVIEAGLGVRFSRRPYDGDYENTVAVLFNTRLRF